jgi:uncharacterized membrane-anchored protein
MQDIVQRFIGFDKLLGPVLVKIVYYSGLLFIALFMAIVGVLGLLRLAADFVAGVVQLLGALTVGAAMLVYWRFICELFMLAFKTFERLGEIRDSLSASAQRPPPDFSQF